MSLSIDFKLLENACQPMKSARAASDETEVLTEETE